MKPAEEWLQNLLLKDNVVRSGTLEIIKQIQLDALKQGMTNAASFVRSRSVKGTHTDLCADEILNIRDNKTTI